MESWSNRTIDKSKKEAAGYSFDILSQATTCVTMASIYFTSTTSRQIGRDLLGDLFFLRSKDDMPFLEYYVTIDTSLQPLLYETAKSLFKRLTMSITAWTCRRRAAARLAVHQPSFLSQDSTTKPCVRALQPWEERSPETEILPLSELLYVPHSRRKLLPSNLPAQRVFLDCKGGTSFS
jgi:hypothetical protein